MFLTFYDFHQGPELMDLSFMTIVEPSQIFIVFYWIKIHDNNLASSLSLIRLSRRAPQDTGPLSGLAW